MTLIVLALAVYRITRLIVLDTIFDRPRDWASQKAIWLETLVTCPWCAGFWISLAATILYALSPTVSFWLFLPFALSAVTGLLSRLEESG